MRRTWIKIYSHQLLHGSVKDELNPAERWIWIGFLCLAGDSSYDGQISITKRMGYTNSQIAELLAVTETQIENAMKKMQHFGKIKVLKNNVVKIQKWEKYQSEYGRQKQYRQKPDDASSGPQEKSYNPKLQPKVTTQSYALDIDIDKDKELEEELRKNKELRTLFAFYKTKHKFTEAEISLEFNKLWEQWPVKQSQKDAYLAFKALRKKVGQQVIWNSMIGYASFLKDKRLNENFDQSPMYLATFLRKERWFEYLGFHYKARL